MRPMTVVRHQVQDVPPILKCRDRGQVSRAPPNFWCGKDRTGRGHLQFRFLDNAVKVVPVQAAKTFVAVTPPVELPGTAVPGSTEPFGFVRTPRRV